MLLDLMVLRLQVVNGIEEQQWWFRTHTYVYVLCSQPSESNFQRHPLHLSAIRYRDNESGEDV